MRLKLAAHGLGRIPFVPHCTSCSSVHWLRPRGFAPQLKRNPLGCTMNCQPFARPRLANSAGSQGTARILGALPVEDTALNESRSGAGAMSAGAAGAGVLQNRARKGPA
jgi:hypothetical protein